MRALIVMLLLLAISSGVRAQDTTKKSVQLNEVIVESPFMQWRKDSIELAETYRKALLDANRKVGVRIINGVTFDGAISRMAEIMSGKRKRDLKFKKQLTQIVQRKWADIRYTPELVMRLNKLTKDEAIIFINQNPIPDDFVRTATEAELWVWIRERQTISKKMGLK